MLASFFELADKIISNASAASIIFYKTQTQRNTEGSPQPVSILVWK